MTDLSILDTKLGDVTEPRKAPPGKYLAQVTDLKFGKLKNDKQTSFADVEFKLKSAQSGQDTTGVNLDRVVGRRIFLTEDNIPYIKKDLREAGIDVTGTLREALEALQGSTLMVDVNFDDYAMKNKQREIPVVTGWKAI